MIKVGKLKNITPGAMGHSAATNCQMVALLVVFARNDENKGDWKTHFDACSGKFFLLKCGTLLSAILKKYKHHADRDTHDEKGD
jgi:hypothetical protein